MRAKDRFLPRARHVAGALVSLLLGHQAGMGQSPLPPAITAAAPGKVMVADVEVRGATTTPVERLRAAIKTRAGTELSRDGINDDVRRLTETGLVANVWVRTEALPGQPDQVKVVFVVSERSGRIREVAYHGAQHLKNDELQSLTNLKKGDPLIPWRNQEAARRILEKYWEQGRPFAQVEVVEGRQPTDQRVVFQITEGPKVKISDIDFTGNTFVSSAVLATRVRSSKKFLGLFGGKFNRMLADLDAGALEEYYKAYGFHDVKVRPEVRYSSTNPGDVVLVFHIHEGPQYRIDGRPQVQGAGKELTGELVHALPRLAPGEKYSQATVDGDVSRIKDYYGLTGRDVRVRAEVFHPAEKPGLCQVQYIVEERPPIRVGTIYIVGNDVTRENVIRRQLEGIEPGQILPIPNLRIAERNLARLNIFEVTPEVHPTVEILDREGDAQFKDILVRVQETRTGSLLFGVGVNSDAGLSGSIVFNERNFDITRFPTSFEDLMSGRAFRGAGQELRVEAVPGTVAQRYTFSFREPFLFDSPYSLTVGGYYYTRIFDEYTETRLGSRIGVGRRLNQYWTANAGVRVEQVGVRDVPWFAPNDFLSVQGDNFQVGLRAGATRDSRDSYLRPTEGSLLDISAEQILGDFTFPLVNVDYNKYWTVYQRNDGGGRHVLAYHGQFSWAGDDAPVYERYYAGGFRSMRGFQFRGVGPDVNGFKVGGHFMLLNSLEYQLPLLANEHLFAVGFVDSGTVEPSLRLKDYRVSAGFGFRFIVPMLGPVPIALDFGFPINRVDSDRDQVFSFWLGFFH